MPRWSKFAILDGRVTKKNTFLYVLWMQKITLGHKKIRLEILQAVRDYKRAITPRFPIEPKVYMYGSYSKDYPLA